LAAKSTDTKAGEVGRRNDRTANEDGKRIQTGRRDRRRSFSKPEAFWLGALTNAGNLIQSRTARQSRMPIQTFPTRVATPHDAAKPPFGRAVPYMVTSAIVFSVGVESQ